MRGLIQLPGGPHILEGEVCLRDELGRSNFDLLQQRAHRRRWYEGADPVVFCAFDLLAQDGKPLLEGLVVERLGSPYKPGERSPDWTKVKRKGAVPPERFKR